MQSRVVWELMMWWAARRDWVIEGLALWDGGVIARLMVEALFEVQTAIKDPGVVLINQTSRWLQDSPHTVICYSTGPPHLPDTGFTKSPPEMGKGTSLSA